VPLCRIQHPVDQLVDHFDCCRTTSPRPAICGPGWVASVASPCGQSRLD